MELQAVGHAPEDGQHDQGDNDLHPVAAHPGWQGEEGPPGGSHPGQGGEDQQDHGDQQGQAGALFKALAEGDDPDPGGGEALLDPDLGRDDGAQDQQEEREVPVDTEQLPGEGVEAEEQEDQAQAEVGRSIGVGGQPEAGLFGLFEVDLGVHAILHD